MLEHVSNNFQLDRSINTQVTMGTKDSQEISTINEAKLKALLKNS